jgi:ribosomal protein S27E
VDTHYEEFKRVYPRRYRKDFGYWRPVIDDVVDKFLRCGDPEHGFARVRCTDCEHERFVAFSCKRRGFCPSCHQKRTLNVVNHLMDHVYEEVPHRQFVFTIPKRFRLYFRYNRDLLSELARCAWRTIQDVYDFFLDGNKNPGAVASIQTFGSLMLWNPHIHMMVTDGGFDENRWFHALPDVSTEPFLKIWEHHVFKMLIDQGRIKPELAKEMSEWD